MIAIPKRIEPRSATERLANTVFKEIAQISALAIAGTLIWIAFLVVVDGMPAMSQFGLKFLFASSWNPVNNSYDVLPAAYGTFVSSFLALLISLPISLGVAIFLSEDYLAPKVQRIFVFLV
mgnify:CR=1 FL=1